MISPTKEIMALAETARAKIDEACPDIDPLTMRAAVLLVAEAYLQTAALEKVKNNVYRQSPSK